MTKKRHWEIRPALPGEGLKLCGIQAAALKKQGAGFYEEKDINLWVSGLDPQEYEFAIADEEVIVAYSGKEILGFGHFKREWEEIKELYVLPDLSGLGIGTRIEIELSRIAKGHKAENLKTFASLNSTEFYKKRGYASGEQKCLEVSPGLFLPFIFMAKRLNIDR